MINIPTFYVQQFSNTLQMLLQQKGSKLRQAVMTGSHVGKQASPVDQIGAVSALQVTTRFGQMGRVDAPTDRRWVFPKDYHVPQLIDNFDKLKLILDPQSAMVQTALNALGRAMDDEILAQIFGDNKTGADAGSTTSFLSGQVVGVAQGAASATGLTVAKLREAKRILMANEVDVDSDPIFAIVKAKQHDNLLNEIQIISKDFNETPVLVDGKITRFLGINFIHCERIPSGTDDASGTSDAVPIFAKSGMYLGMWSDMQTSISVRNDLESEPIQVYAKASFGATRLEEKKICKVWCR